MKPQDKETTKHCCETEGDLTLSNDPALSKDPVCGMSVAEEEKFS